MPFLPHKPFQRANTLSPGLAGYGLTTASILYRLPDYQSLLQTFIWQDCDTEPEFPKLRAFIAYWEANLAGPIYSVDVVHKCLLSPDDFTKRLN
jgi:uncharacterized protein Usg